VAKRELVASYLEGDDVTADFVGHSPDDRSPEYA
jgi:hypothetical protein